MASRRSGWFLLGVLFALGFAGEARAQRVDEGSLAAARALGREGLDALDKRDYATALDRLQRAYQVVKAPSLALWSARALEKNGKLVEAAERYLEATRLEATTGDAATQRQARLDAAREREAMLPRIPQLTVQCGANNVSVLIDDVAVPAALLGAPRPVNPGSHWVVAKTASRQARKQVELKEGQKQTITLALAPEPTGATSAQPASLPQDTTTNPAPPPAATSPHPTGRREAAPGAEMPSSGGSWQRTTGWTALGLGGVGLLTGGTAGIFALAKWKSDSIANGCTDGRCPPSLHGDVDTYNAARTVSTIGFIVGAVGVGAGIGLLLAAPKSGAVGLEVHPYLGGTTLGVQGSY